MNALIVVANPEPDSFNGRMKSVAQETLETRGYKTEVSDLYAEKFDPVEGPGHYPSRSPAKRFNGMTEQYFAATHDLVSADVRAMVEKLDRADLVILQYPMWWYSVPAILKGWLDRVLVYGSVYTTEMRYDKGRFAGRRAMLSVTCGGSQGSYAEDGRNGDVNLFVFPTNYTLAYIGYTVLPPFSAFGVVPPSTPANEAQALAHLKASEERYRQHLLTLDSRPPLQFNKWGDWDQSGRLKPDVKIHNVFSRSATAQQ
jgi:NAD(P)H dehydrogenase (quinone)